MKKFKRQEFFSLILFSYIGFAACENTIMEKWWDTPSKSAGDAGSTELYVDSVLKMEAKLPTLLAWIKSNITDNTYYIIRVGEDDSLLPEEGHLHYPSKIGVTITLAGKDQEQTVTITDNAKGSLFDVGANVTLILSENITLKGHNDNNNSLVMVSSGGTMIMKDGATVKGNINTTAPSSTDWRSGGISVDGILIMDGGIVTGNRCNNGGGGIGILSGTFTMNSGSINNNEAAIDGGGVQIYTGTFIMNGGIISNNRVTTMSPGTWVVGGGGVYISINANTFTKNGGVIYGSDAPDGLANSVLYYGMGGGAAVYTYQNSKARNATLYENDSISTTNWNIGWE